MNLLIIIPAIFLLVVCKGQISQNCAGSSCYQKNHFGRRRRQIVDEIQTLTEETLKIEKIDADECECFNPLAGSTWEWRASAGETEHVCNSVGWCFVKCDSKCSDAEELEGFFKGQCKSVVACPDE